MSVNASILYQNEETANVKNPKCDFFSLFCCVIQEKIVKLHSYLYLFILIWKMDHVHDPFHISHFLKNDGMSDETVFQVFGYHTFYIIIQ